ncbi:BTAD domain-containing putative transcriptional regulator, partial [Amycolatopsis lurida]
MEHDRTGQPEFSAGVLGALEVRLGGVPLPLGPSRQRSVLAVLLLEADRVVPIDRLMDRVWGDRAPTRSRSVLRTYLSRLRQTLAPAGVTITWQDIGYRLTIGTGEVDVHRFRRLLGQARAGNDPVRAVELADEALALWRGDPLAELDTPWAGEIRERLDNERAAAAADRIDWALDCGRHRELLPDLFTQTTADPLNERAAGQLMLALYRDGRQADALEHYQRLRRHLIGELGTEPGAELQQLHQRILAADLGPVRATAASPVPRQLPAPPAPFVGRQEELDRLDAALAETGGMGIAVVAGPGGIGKTWLALHWAHRHLDRFPDGQLFVDLHGFSPGGDQVDPAVAVRGFLDALGVDRARLPAEPAAQAALYRSLVAGKRLLVVLDNAATAEQVVPLLPGSPSCAVLVTGRVKLASLIDRHGARHVRLDVLTEEEAYALLAERLGELRVATEPAAGELAELCGYYPLALSITARHAATRPRVPLAEFAAELRELGMDMLDNDDPAASLPAALSWSLRAMTEPQRTVFALLGSAPGPGISLPAAAALLGLSTVRTRKALQALEDASLIERHAGDRYAMHDLIRAYAATVDVAEPERQAALERVLDFYLQTAHAAERLLNPHRRPIDLPPPAADVQVHPPPDDAAALAWLTAEHAQLLTAQQAAAAAGHHRVVWQLAWTLHTFHYRRGLFRDELAVWQAALAAAEYLPDPAVRSLVQRVLGRAHALLGQLTEATEHLNRALELAERHHDLAQLAYTHYDLAGTWELSGNDQRALEHGERALDLFRSLDQPVREAQALNGVGWSAARLGDYDAARAHCEAALVLHRRHHDAQGEAATLDSLGYVEHQTGRHRQAVHHYRRALALRRELGHAYEVANTLDNCGHPYAALGDHDQARQVWWEALELYRDQGRTEDFERVRRQLDAIGTWPRITAVSA